MLLLGKVNTVSHKHLVVVPSSTFTVTKEIRDIAESANIELQVNTSGKRLSFDELLDFIPDQAVSCIAGLEKYPAELLARKNIRCISRIGVGIDNIDAQYAKRHDIEIRVTAEEVVYPVAELTVSMLLTMSRMVSEMVSSMRTGIWSKISSEGLAGKKIGIIGYGRIGRETHRLLRAFPVEIKVHDTVAMDFDYFEPSLLEIAEWADAIVIHASGNSTVIDSEVISRVRDGSLILNPARANCLSEELILIHAPRLGAVWVDTYEKEPYQGPLSELRNVYCTPHICSNTISARADMERKSLLNIVEALYGS